MTPEENSRSARQAERDAKREAEYEAGRRLAAKYALLDKIQKSQDKLKQAFPTLLIGTVINKPYTMVTVRATRKPNLSPLFSTVLLTDEEMRRMTSVDQEIDLEDPVEEFPSDHLIAQLALIA